MMKLIVFTSVLTAGSLFMSASYAADEVQTQEQAVERAMDQTRTMQSDPGAAQPGMRQNMEQNRYQHKYQNGPGYGQGGMNRQGGYEPSGWRPGPLRPECLIERLSFFGPSGPFFLPLERVMS